MSYITHVCEKCHKKDENVIKCRAPFESHSGLMTSLCDICGKMKPVGYCPHYPSHIYGRGTREVSK